MVSPPNWDIPDWSEQARLKGPRANPFELPSEEFQKAKERGRLLAVAYPEFNTDTLLPLVSMQRFFGASPGDPLRKLLFYGLRELLQVRSIEEAYQWLGLHEFPLERDLTHEVFDVPFPHGKRPDVWMGLSQVDTPLGPGLTFACVACHSGDLFGKKVIGLTNRFPRGNGFAKRIKDFTKAVGPMAFQAASGASQSETEMYRRFRSQVRWTESKEPRVLGLDTSLSEAALSLSRREDDAQGSRTDRSARLPRANDLRQADAEVKPPVWWNLKYKTRWLYDGSLTAGNIIHTNFLWIELARGGDLNTLENWMQSEKQNIIDLTTAAFASEAPRYTDFFQADAIDLEAAKVGEMHYLEHCAKCHGVYEKGWSKPDMSSLSLLEKIATVQVRYADKTRVIDVGTDPARYLGMQSFAKDLERLALQKTFGIRVRPTQGYVPPPLVGIWARWPYFHNNSAPNLCAVITRSELRPRAYFAGPADVKETDFDSACVGYPTQLERVPEAWKKNRETTFDASLPGLGNQGHDEGVFLKDGVELLSDSNKRALIEFLKTL